MKKESPPDFSTCYASCRNAKGALVLGYGWEVPSIFEYTRLSGLHSEGWYSNLYSSRTFIPNGVQIKDVTCPYITDSYDKGFSWSWVKLH